MPLIRRLRESGYEVFALPNSTVMRKNKKEADNVFNLLISRKGVNPFVDILTFFHISYSK